MTIHESSHGKRRLDVDALLFLLHLVVWLAPMLPELALGLGLDPEPFRALTSSVEGFAPHVEIALEAWARRRALAPPEEDRRDEPRDE